MIGKDVYKVWAPYGEKWVNWVRPVPFNFMTEELNNKGYINIRTYDLDYVKNIDNKTAIIVDLSGVESINEGLSLALKGFRPIPVYNGVLESKGSFATSDNSSIIVGLLKGANKLKEIDIPKDARPTFLIDKNRMCRYKMDESVFDNSWDLYYQDIPSAEYFLENGIDKIVVRSNRLEYDLRLILYKFQTKGIKIYLCNGGECDLLKIKKTIDKDF